MKKFIAFCIFMVGLLLSWPPGEQVKVSGTDQMCFIADVGHVNAITYAQNTVQYQTYKFVAVNPPIVCVAEGIIQKVPDFYKMVDLNYRTCLTEQVFRNQNKLQIKRGVHQSIIRIRDDTSLV